MHPTCPSVPLTAALRAAERPVDLNEDALQTVRMVLDGHFPDGTPLTRETFHARRNEQRAASGLAPLSLADPAPSLRGAEALLTARAFALPVLLGVALTALLLVVIFDPASLTGFSL